MEMNVENRNAVEMRKKKSSVLILSLGASLLDSEFLKVS